MGPRRSRLLAIAVALTALLAIGGAVWAISRIAVTGRQDRTLQGLDADATRTPSPSAPATSPLPISEPSTKATDPSVSASPRRFAFLREVLKQRRSVTVDFAEFLTGDEAARAARADGNESPPPNDYYIVNEDEATQTLKLSPSVRVRLTTDDEGSAVAEGFAATIDDLQRQLRANPDWRSFRGFWLELDDGVVVEISEQFAP